MVGVGLSSGSGLLGEGIAFGESIGNIGRGDWSWFWFVAGWGMYI
jgi:hypothetical protein